VAPIAKADEWDKETVVTFSAPVEVPGKDLLAGTYVFKLAVPTIRIAPADATILTLKETAGTSEAVKSWFYPGDTDGLEFVYPKYSVRLPRCPAAVDQKRVPGDQRRRGGGEEHNRSRHFNGLADAMQSSDAIDHIGAELRI
jgi:hypothetical protein